MPSVSINFTQQQLDRFEIVLRRKFLANGDKTAKQLAEEYLAGVAKVLVVEEERQESIRQALEAIPPVVF